MKSSVQSVCLVSTHYSCMLMEQSNKHLVAPDSALHSTMYAFLLVFNMTIAMKILVNLLLLASTKAFVAPRHLTASRRPARGGLGSTIVDPPTTEGGAVLETQPEPELDEDKFDWYKSWYPLVPVDFLDEEQPHQFELLGMKLVVWKDAAIAGAEFGPKVKGPRTGGEWRVMVDECPHRKVPLSEGRIENDGSLLCSYHAWRFDGKGTLVNAPQLEQAALDRLKSSPKSSCRTFPTKIIDGCLWVWPETGSDARIESALTPPPVCELPEGVDESRVWYGPWNFRELPYGADYFMENVVDPAHVAVSHHNIVGSRYADQRVSVQLSSKMTKKGFSVNTRANGNPYPAETVFKAPSTVNIQTRYGDGGAYQMLELYASPSRPGFCNHVGRMVVVRDENGAMPKLLKQFTLPMPIWINHLLAATFLHQDALFLHHQERQLARTGEYASVTEDSNSDYQAAVLPIETDRGVLAFRDWLRKKAGGFIPYRHRQSMPEPDTEVVFDVWNGHTKHCRVCLTAVKRLKMVRAGAFMVAYILAVLQPSTKPVNFAGSLLATSYGVLVHKVVGRFYRAEFSHVRND